MEHLSQLEGSRFNFVFLCRVHWEFSILQYSFLKLQQCLAKMVKADGVSLWRPTFLYGECGRLLDMSVKYFVKLVFRNGIVLQPADRVGGKKQGHLEGRVFCLYLDGNAWSLRGTVTPEQDRCKLHISFPPLGICIPCSETIPRKPLNRFFF